MCSLRADKLFQRVAFFGSFKGSGRSLDVDPAGTLTIATSILRKAVLELADEIDAMDIQLLASHRYLEGTVPSECSVKMLSLCLDIQLKEKSSFELRARYTKFYTSVIGEVVAQ